MKIFCITALLSAVILSLTGCGGMGSPSFHTPGFLYSDVSVPGRDLTVNTSTDSTIKSGKATCTSIIGLVSLGDCTVDAARKAGGVTKISNVEYHVSNILGVYSEYTTKVHGQ